MNWCSSLQSGPSFDKAIRTAIDDIKRQLGKTQADLGLLFVSAEYRSDVIDLWPSLVKNLPVKHVLGCSADGVIGGGREIEEQPALSFTAGVLPQVEVTPFAIDQRHLPDADAGPKAWRELVNRPAGGPCDFLLLSDPFSLDADALIAGLDFSFSSAVKVGGLASGGRKQGDNILFSGDRIVSHGAVGVALSGDIHVEAVVAQGCRPIGELLTITASDGNVLMSANHQPPLAYLQTLYESLAARDQELLQTSLFIGIVMDSFNKTPKQGDFLIRNIIGLDQEKGMLAVGSQLRQGQTVQFHLRDAATSHDDLHLMLSKSVSAQAHLAGPPAESGAVLFSCVGRGKRLYGQPDHDSTIFRSVVGDVPLGGFFCNGEIGPVGGKTYLHGYTSSIAVFSPIKKQTGETV